MTMQVMPVSTEEGGNAVLPGIPNITQADLDLVAKAKELEHTRKIEGSLVRFTNTFKLESEVIGASKSTKKKANKAGAVTLSLLPQKSKEGESLESVFKLTHGRTPTKDELAAFGRLESDKLKSAEAQLVTRIAGNAEWTGLRYSLSAKGDTLKVEFKKVEPIGVTLTKEPTEAEMLAKLGMTAEQYAPIKAAKLAKEQADAEAAAKAKLEADAAKAQADGETGKLTPEEQALIDNEAKELAELEKQIAEEERKANASSNGEVDKVIP